MIEYNCTKCDKNKFIRKQEDCKSNAGRGEYENNKGQ
jgi:hypothetical protein